MISIPDIKEKKFFGIIATHHGGPLSDEIKAIPNPSADCGNIVYSYGTENKYHHPTKDSILKYIKVGWSIYRKTPDGSVSFTLTMKKRISCRCKCNLDVEQVF